MLAAVAARVPELAAYAGFTLDRGSRYWFQTASGAYCELSAEEGVDQGAPLSPAFFAAGVRDALTRLEERLRALADELGEDPEEVTIMAYLDDVLLGLPPSLVQRGLELAREELATAGLDLVEAKTHAWAPEPPPTAVLDWLKERGFWCPEGFRLLGTLLSGGREVALGTEGFTDAFLRAKAAEARNLVRKVAELTELVDPEWPAAQVAFQLLRQCGNQLLSHPARTTPPEQIREVAEAYDEEVLRAAEKVAGLDPLSEDEKEQLRLPLRLGGFGLASLAALADSAWLGSWLQCLAGVVAGSSLLRGLGTSVSALTTSLRCAEAQLEVLGVSLWEATTRNGEGSWEEAEKHSVTKGQRHLQHQAAKSRQAALLERAPREVQARLRSCGGPGAAAWLQALPTAPDLCLPDKHFRLACRMRLGQQQFPEGKTCQRRTRRGRVCGAPLDPGGDHAHTCDIGRCWQVRHDGQRRATARILRRHHLEAVEEVRVPEFDRDRANGTRQLARLDLRVGGGPGGPVRFADHKVSHPGARSYVRDAAKADGATARKGERAKAARYGRQVLALVNETYGRWGPEALHWWRALAKQVAESDPLLKGRGKWAVAGLLAQWWAETSVALQRANAEALLASLGEPVRAPTTGEPGTAEAGEDGEDPGLGDGPTTDVLLPAGR